MKKNILPILTGVITAWFVGSLVAVASVNDYSNSLMILLFGVGIGFGTLLGLIPGFLVGYLVYTIQERKTSNLLKVQALKKELEEVKQPARKTAPRKPRANSATVKPAAKTTSTRARK